jgi:hypothetical protein
MREPAIQAPPPYSPLEMKGRRLSDSWYCLFGRADLHEVPVFYPKKIPFFSFSFPGPFLPDIRHIPVYLVAVPVEMKGFTYKP